MQRLDRLPWGVLIVLCVGLGLAPFFEQPHLIEKLGMLFSRELREPIDWLDLVWHSWPFVLVAIKAVRQIRHEPSPVADR